MFLVGDCGPSTSRSDADSIQEKVAIVRGNPRFFPRFGEARPSWEMLKGASYTSARRFFQLGRRWEIIGLRHILTVFVFFAFPSTIYGYHRSNLQNSEGSHAYTDLMSTPKEHCYSCFSHAYLPMWNVLMLHYFPPHNFTDRCWQPDAQIGTVLCNSACFTIVERVTSPMNDFLDNEHQAVMRGCVDRFLLFGLDDDVKTGLMSVDRRHTNVCKQSSRKILKMYPLTSSENDLVYLCTCVGPRCNEQDMLNKPDAATNPGIALVSFIIISFHFLLY